MARQFIENMKNMKKTVLLFYVLVFSVFAFAQQVRPVKNVIVMIPDGTSIGVYSAARWYKMYNKLGDALNVDPYITGRSLPFRPMPPLATRLPQVRPMQPESFSNRATWPFIPKPIPEKTFIPSIPREPINPQ